MKYPPKWMSATEVREFEVRREQYAALSRDARVSSALGHWYGHYSFPPTLRELAWASNVSAKTARKSLASLSAYGYCTGTSGNTRAIALVEGVEYGAPVADSH